MRLLRCLGLAAALAACGKGAEETREEIPDAGPLPGRPDARVAEDRAVPADVATPISERDAAVDAVRAVDAAPAVACAPPRDRDQPVAKLSATGCVDPNDPKKPAPGLIPFDVASPLWSDGAEKLRYMALPAGGKIKVKDCKREPATCRPVAQGGTSEDEGHFEFPRGTVLMKSFLIEGRFIETRLFVRFSDGAWVGYSYVWNDAQTDADVIPSYIEARERKVQKKNGTTQTWYYPSRRDCLTCHTEAAGFSLGPEVVQLNRDFTYPNGTKANQLQTLESMGLFEAPLARPFATVLPTPTVDATGTLEARARAYLHTNCALCHRPGGEMATFDVRFGTRLADAGICNVAALRPGFDADTRLLMPGNPAKSIMSLRMHVLDNRRMPQIASSVVDEEGVKVVDAWIRGLTRCP